MWVEQQPRLDAPRAEHEAARAAVVAPEQHRERSRARFVAARLGVLVFYPVRLFERRMAFRVRPGGRAGRSRAVPRLAGEKQALRILGRGGGTRRVGRVRPRAGERLGRVGRGRGRRIVLGTRRGSRGVGCPEARRDFRGGRREPRVGVARRRGGHRARSCGASLGADALPNESAGGDTWRARADFCGDGLGWHVPLSVSKRLG